MPVSPTYPGVYVQEVPSGVRTIAGVPTAVALFVGAAKQGPIGVPVRITNYKKFRDTFSEDVSAGDMTRYLRLFYMNGGTDCYVMRIANGASSSTVILKSETGGPGNVLTLTAKQAGAVGESIRAVVSYSLMQPEGTFDIELFMWVVDPSGNRVRSGEEIWKNLSMDPSSPLYAPTFLTQNSKLVTAQAAAGLTGAKGFSQSGRPVPFRAATLTTFSSAWQALLGTTAPPTAGQQFQISVDGSPYVLVDNLDLIDFSTFPGPIANIKQDLAGVIKQRIEDAFSNQGLSKQVTVTFPDGPTPLAPNDTTSLLRITTASATGDVSIRPAGSGDASIPLMLGTEQGGLEVAAFAANRPAPTGLTFRGGNVTQLNAFASLTQQDINQIRLEALTSTGTLTTVNIPVNLATTGLTDPMYEDANPATGNTSGVREKLGLIRDAINDFAQANPQSFFWTADLRGNRLSITASRQAHPNFVSSQFRTQPTDVASRFTSNVRFYSVGRDGVVSPSFPDSEDFQVAALQAASDGTAPAAADYQAAYELADKEIDLFNLLVLPPNAGPPQPHQQLYGPASIFCQQRRAFLVMDPPASWTDPMVASSGVAALRIGLVKDYSAVFFPRLTVNEGGLDVPVGPAGAIAGLMARIDGESGVWKAPAGVEADLRGIVGLEQRLSDAENGILNPQGINVQRIFPNGIVNWGARTMDGADDFASEYKYIPIRRLALFMEESLYRGLKWVVFEGNGPALWAQIRLNVGAFMQTLFRKGAFAGTTPSNSYFVKCDDETTTPTDQQLGVVNIWVGFAPLRPAEFVILYLQQMTAQAEA